MLTTDQHEILTEARRRTLALLDSLERGRDELHSAPLEGQNTYSAVIDAARNTLHNLDRALARSGGDSTSS
jgi:hypothetical protein